MNETLYDLGYDYFLFIDGVRKTDEGCEEIYQRMRKGHGERDRDSLIMDFHGIGKDLTTRWYYQLYWDAWRIDARQLFLRKKDFERIYVPESKAYERWTAGNNMYDGDEYDARPRDTQASMSLLQER